MPKLDKIVAKLRDDKDDGEGTSTSNPLKSKSPNSKKLALIIGVMKKKKGKKA